VARPGRSSRSLAILLTATLGWPSGLFAAPQERRIERVKGGEAAVGTGGRWAVVVGVDRYQAKAIEPLSGAVADAKAIRDVLIQYAEFPEAQVTLLVSDGAEKPTRPVIMDKLDQIASAAKPTDLVLFFFAGHGVQVSGERHLLTFEADPSSPGHLKTSSLSAPELMHALETMKVAHRVVMVDACRNDPTNPTQRNVADEAFESAFTLQPASEGGVRATFLSSSKGQSAYEWTDKHRGFFSYFIEKGLSGEAALYNKVTVTSLLSYLSEMVPQKVREQKNQVQIPYAKVEGSELVLVRGEKLPAQTAALDKQPRVAAARTIFGVVKDSGGLSLAGATITVAFAGGVTRGVGGKPGSSAELKLFTDEDGFFTVDGVTPDVEVKVTAAKDAYLPKTLVSPPAEAGKKLVVFLPRAEAARPVVLADAGGPAPAARKPQPEPPATTAPAATAMQPAISTPAAPVGQPSPAAGQQATTPAQPSSTSGQPTTSTQRAATGAAASVTGPPPPPVSKPPQTTGTSTSATAKTAAATAATAPAPATVADLDPSAALLAGLLEGQLPSSAPPTTAPASSVPRVTSSITTATPTTTTPTTKPPTIPPATTTPVTTTPKTAASPGAPPAAPVEARPVKSGELAMVAYRTFLAEDFKEAENAARQALQVDPEDALANAVLSNAMAAVGVNSDDIQATLAAKEFIDKALSRDAAQPLAHNAFGLMLMAQGHNAEALVEVQKAIQADVKLAAAHANRANLLRMQDKFADAEREYREAIRLEPENAVPYNGLSVVLFSMGKYKDAVQASRDAISRYQLRDRFLGLFYVQLAVAQFQQGRQGEALESVGRAKALGVADHATFTTIAKGKPAKKR